METADREARRSFTTDCSLLTWMMGEQVGLMPSYYEVLSAVGTICSEPLAPFLGGLALAWLHGRLPHGGRCSCCFEVPVLHRWLPTLLCVTPAVPSSPSCLCL